MFSAVVGDRFEKKVAAAVFEKKKKNLQPTTDYLICFNIDTDYNVQKCTTLQGD